MRGYFYMDITLISGSVSGVVTAVNLSRKTMRNIRQNLVFAFGYNTTASRSRRVCSIRSLACD
jgi:cation transport ATPase